MGSKRRMHPRRATYCPSRYVTTTAWSYGPYQSSMGGIISRAGTRRGSNSGSHQSSLGEVTTQIQNT